MMSAHLMSSDLRFNLVRCHHQLVIMFKAHSIPRNLSLIYLGQSQVTLWPRWLTKHNLGMVLIKWMILLWRHQRQICPQFWILLCKVPGNKKCWSRRIILQVSDSHHLKLVQKLFWIRLQRRTARSSISRNLVIAHVGLESKGKLKDKIRTYWRNWIKF